MKKQLLFTLTIVGALVSAQGALAWTNRVINADNTSRTYYANYYSILCTHIEGTLNPGQSKDDITDCGLDWVANNKNDTANRANVLAPDMTGNHTICLLPGSKIKVVQKLVDKAYCQGFVQ